MFANASMRVLPFDPRFGADHARQYASKYASKLKVVPVVPTSSFAQRVQFRILDHANIARTLGKPEKWHHVPELTASQNV